MMNDSNDEATSKSLEKCASYEKDLEQILQGVLLRKHTATITPQPPQTPAKRMPTFLEPPPQQEQSSSSLIDDSSEIATVFSEEKVEILVLKPLPNNQLWMKVEYQSITHDVTVVCLQYQHPTECVASIRDFVKAANLVIISNVNMRSFLSHHCEIRDDQRVVYKPYSELHDLQAVGLTILEKYCSENDLASGISQHSN